jgi:glutamate-1-semialdehyde 2,1-aminomutase
MPDKVYREQLAGSFHLHDRARAALAGAATHDSWRQAPFAPVFLSAKGPYKFDIDGRRYVDLWMGHGSLILGHGDSKVLQAVCEQLYLGTHLSGLTLAAIEWAEAIQGLVPAAEAVRFTASGSEAVHLAFRVARFATRRKLILRLGGHYHGWHESALAGVAPPQAIGQVTDCGVEVLPYDALEEIESRLSAGDIAGVILEPGGGGSGVLDWSLGYLRRLRMACNRHSSMLIFDEVISGFRYAPGGVQGLTGVMPDMTVLAKIMAGGFPGGALVGSNYAMSGFVGSEDSRGSCKRLIHAGTFNGFALSAKAGVTTLRQIADGSVLNRAEAAAESLVRQVNWSARATGIDAGMFRNSSTIHLVFGCYAAGVVLSPSSEAFQLIATQPNIHAEMRRNLLKEGVDMHPTHGWLSSAHDDAAIALAAGAFDRAFSHLVATGIAGSK